MQKDLDDAAKKIGPLKTKIREKFTQVNDLAKSEQAQKIVTNESMRIYQIEVVFVRATREKLEKEKQSYSSNRTDRPSYSATSSY